MRIDRYILVFVLCTLSLCTLSAVERTILLGPKTIGKAWKDNILIESRHFASAKAGDVLTVYNDNAKGMAQAAFQHPKTWQGVAPEYGCFGFAGPFRMTLSDSIIKYRAHVRNHPRRSRLPHLAGHAFRGFGL